MGCRRGDFRETDVENAPYAHVVADLTLEVVAISANWKLAPAINGIASRLERLLNEAGSRLGGVAFEVGSIPEPDQFLNRIRAAYAVQQFSMTVRRPNAFDVEAHFVRPVQRLLVDSAGDAVRATIKGTDLNRGTIEELTRSAASTSDPVSARLVTTKGAPPVLVRLAGENVLFTVDALDDPDDRASALHRLRDAYHRVRGML